MEKGVMYIVPKKIRSQSFTLSFDIDDEQQSISERLKFAMFFAGSRWDKVATPEELLVALDAAGFKIVEKDHSLSE